MIVDDGRSPMLVPYSWYLHECASCGSKIRRHRQHRNASWYLRRNLPVVANPITWTSTNGSQRCGDAPYGQGHNRKRFDYDLQHTPERTS